MNEARDNSDSVCDLALRGILSKYIVNNTFLIACIENKL